ncbi:MAG: hypothetical protein IIW21_02085 [Clostridia bacterium]|nr:hypothetical protein [Clostridia bacterium]
MNNLFEFIGTDTAGNTFEVEADIKDMGNAVTVTVSSAFLASKNADTLLVRSALSTARAGDKGYMFFPTNFYYGYALCYFDEKPDTLYKSWPAGTPVCGLCANENAVFIHVEKEDFDARFYVEVKGGIYSISTHFRFDGDTPDEDVVITYHRMPGATYADMARFYRASRIKDAGCVPLTERVKQREPLRRAADCLELRIRMGWKPIPTPVRSQTLENEPEMYVAATVETLNKIIDALQRHGVDKAEICLVGWGPGGHDGRFPQQYPSDERYGGDDALREFIARAQRLGYQIVCHTVSCGAYEIANNWDWEKLTYKKGEDGKLIPYLRDHYKEKGLNGGDPWSLCAKTAYEDYAIKDLPEVRSYGFMGLHYIDEFTAIIPEKCYHPDHPVSRKQAREYFRKCAQLAKKLFGGYQCEGYMDFMNADVDSILYTGVQSKLTHDMNPLFDDSLPFWQLVYHGIVLSNATSQTINYTIKEEYQHLKYLEYGARPVMYFHSNFGADRNWMGDIDLLCNNDENIEKAAKAIKKAYDEFETLKHLQYEFMEDHVKIEDGVYRTTYSDGTTVTVNYNDLTYDIKAPGEEDVVVPQDEDIFWL